MSTKRSHEAIADECTVASYETYDDGQNDYSDLFRRAAAALRNPITVTDAQATRFWHLWNRREEALAPWQRYRIKEILQAALKVRSEE